MAASCAALGRGSRARQATADSLLGPRTRHATFTIAPMPTPAPSATDLRYPIGRLERKSSLSGAERRSAIDAIAAAPAALRAAVRGLSDAQLDTPYRDGGWTVRQLVHHVADSHMHAYARVRFALTEKDPTIKPYDEATWARLPDSALPVEVSLVLLERLHERLVHLLRAIPEADFERTLRHPENGPMTIDALLSVYSWHGRHHVAHVTALRERMKWT
jgi:uncharacterized damage-inducible protein DinB